MRCRVLPCPSVSASAHCQSTSNGKARQLVAWASARAAARGARMMFCHATAGCVSLLQHQAPLILPKACMWPCSAGGRTQPFYHVKVDERDQLGTTTYVAQENIEILRLKDVTHGDLLIVHDDEVR